MSAPRGSKRTWTDQDRPPQESRPVPGRGGKPVQGAKKWLYSALGCLFVALAALGVALPGIPTTPFLILASYFFVRSSPRMHRKLLESRTFGPVLRDWERHRALRPRVKRFAILASATLIALSLAFGGLPWYARLLVAAAGAYGIWFVSRLPVVPDRERA